MRPEQPPPLTPRRRAAEPRPWTSWRRLISLRAFGVNVTIGVTAEVSSISRRPPLLRLDGDRRGLGGGFLLVIRQCGLDGVFGQHGAMDLHRRQVQLLHDVGVLDLKGLIDRAALQPLRCEAGAGDRRTAAEGLELRVHNAIVLDLDLQLHDVPALRGAYDPGTYRFIVLRQAPHVSRVIVMVNDLFTISHDPSSLSHHNTLARRAMP